MVNKIVLGVDPDSSEHGVALYINGKLESLQRLSLPQLINKIISCKDSGDDIIVSVENVLANNFVYARNNQATKAAQAKVGLSIGRCQQSQSELMRWLDYIGIPYVLHKPTKSNWHDNKALFEKVTGWTKQSNDDTRSAAYMGWLALN